MQPRNVFFSNKGKILYSTRDAVYQQSHFVTPESFILKMFFPSLPPQLLAKTLSTQGFPLLRVCQLTGRPEIRYQKLFPFNSTLFPLDARGFLKRQEKLKKKEQETS